MFQPIKINNLAIRNRFVMSAAADNLKDNSVARVKRFSRLAEGGAGLIISGGMRIHNVDAWQEVVAAVHNKEGKIAIQLVSKPGPGISAWSDPNKEAIAVSVLPQDHVFFNTTIKYGKHRSVTEAEIKNIINTYAKAALNIKNIGADAVQIHAAY
jgi:2,4-dienoyl-CoA reductase-like NADH-dependent reductase (Old Yellow Enzyme family)